MGDCSMTTLNVNKWQTAGGTTINNVVQTKSFHYATYQAWTAAADATPYDTALTLSITPKYSTSKIYVLCSPNIFHATSSSVVRARVKRTGPATTYSTSASASAMTGWTTCNYTGAPATASYMSPNQNIQWFDSPASTSACTYTLQICGNTSSQVVGLNGTGLWGSTWAGSSQIVLMEIAQ
jgi:hypothetical protein